MEKKGKVDLYSVVIASILIFVVYAVLVFGELSISSIFPENATNASASFGYGTAADTPRFNASNATFNCTVRANSSAVNISNISLFIAKGTPGTRDTIVKNQTQRINVTGPVIYNVSFNLTTTPFDEGNYYWFCEAMQNFTDLAGVNAQANFTSVNLNRTFTIDRTGPLISNISNYTGPPPYSTGNNATVSANFSDQFTNIHTIRLFINFTGTQDNEVLTSQSANIYDPENNTGVNFSFAFPGFALNDVLNVTLWANDSVNNYNITSFIYVITGDGTPPAINLSTPINLHNQSNASVTFTFSAIDNNETKPYNFTCGINVSLATATGLVEVQNISNIVIENGTLQTNSTLGIVPRTLTNGTYGWNVSCTDRAGNLNTSLTQNFTVDNIAPAHINFTLNITLGNFTPEGVPVNGDGSWAQGRQFAAIANFTENLTIPLEATLQYYNESGSTWVNINTTQDQVDANISNAARFVNASATLNFTPATGHNYFEGRNVSFRIIVNDSVGNVNTSTSVLNATVMINDTTKPSLNVTIDLGNAQEGNRAVNNTNTSDNTPTVIWNVTEGNALRYIAIQIDGSTPGGACNKFVNYTVTDGNVESNRNGSITVSSSSVGTTCPLANGSRAVRVTAEDTWGNSELYIHNIVIQTGEGMNITLGMINTSEGFANLQQPTLNRSNITPYHRLSFNVTLDGGASTLKNVTWISSCQSTQQNYTNATAVAVFNYSGCKDTQANQTVTVTAYDFADNSVTRHFGFAVDDLGPTITVHYPTNGLSTDGQVGEKIEVNVSAFDKMSRISTIGYYLDGVENILNHTINGSTLTDTTDTNATIINASINFSVGTHTIKVRVNDTLGNVRNSSVITFTKRGSIDFLEVNLSLRSYLGFENFSNISIFNITGGLFESTKDANQTLQLFMVSNLTKTFINTTIVFNGSAANWNAINFSLTRNESKILKGIENNFSADVVEVITLNGSINQFISDNNSYYGFIELALNASSLGEKLELWYFADDTQLNSRINITKCGTSGYTRTTTSPCWNDTSNLNTTTRVYVPHFSAVALVNESSEGPNVTINFPAGTQTESSFFANITMTNDAVLCNVTVIGANTTIRNSTMSGPSTFGQQKICTFHLNITNSTDENNNITFHVYDASGNVNISVLNFNVSDLTVHNLSSVANTTTGSTTWTITATANESINATINYSTSSDLSKGVITSGGGFAKSAAVSLSSLSADTRYYFNITTCDRAKNCIENGTYTFVTDAAAATTTTTTTTTTSGGGGGGGGGAVSTVTDSKAQVWLTVPSGSSISLNVDKETIAVTSVIVNNAKSELKSVEIEVAALSANPVSTDAAPKVYQYLRITKKNLADADAESFKVAFRVTKSWLSENGLASGDISLYRFASDEWNELTTSVTGTDATYVNYEANTPGFSSFAVGTKSGVVAEEKIPEEVAEEEKEEAAPPEAVKVPEPVKAPGKAPIAWIIAAIVVILGIVLIVAYQKQKKKV